MATVDLRLRGLHKRFEDFLALDDVSLDVAAGELVCLLGPSGCGKTTLLRCIAGLERQDAGTIAFGGRDVSHLPPQARDYGILFQSYALFPHLDVAANVAYGLRGWSRTASQARVAELLALVGLSDSARKYPSQLSGGQQQRIALARALAPRPSLLLLDEPLSALDAQVRERLCGELRGLQRQLGITTLMVTHDQDEALLMADRIAVLNQGRIEQYAAPEDLYRRPASPFVAEFIGRGNWLPYELREGVAWIGDQALTLPTPSPAGPGRLFCRPEAILVNPPVPQPNLLQGRVRERIFLCNRCRLGFELNALPGLSLIAELAPEIAATLDRGSLRVALPPHALQVFAA
ncbi:MULTISPECIES: putative 2-aminoethylphosphonate ABC transporter ATP-binding protein [unclassified Pseudomonas]|uniref:putative 2-aminoethylphosphonate ABC transporter ATP-binding protein n=1 Tax=unclassified Pseudomonas TaxID=196821 RepID=UPI00131D71F5|nr:MULTISPECIES: putative 2-aminoethylphosphonate ABC transporter ATP-binding protein [unclassified Pseudomonas]